jgi:hypothetical protein
MFIMAALPATGQGVFSNQTNTALQRVIEDYPNKFSNIKGDRINGDHRLTDYYSKIEVPGANKSIVTEAKSDGCSWRSELFVSEDFTTSKGRFKEVFENIKNTIVKIEGMTPFILNGKFQHPAEDSQATTIAFNLLPASEELQKLRVELSLRKVVSEWKIILAVIQQE